MNHPVTEITRKRIAENTTYHTGKDHPLFGTKRTHEQKLAHSTFMKNMYARGFVHPFKGKAHSEETKKIIREKRLRQVFPIKDTSIEIALQNALIEIGVHFEKHVPLPGQPDLFIRPNLCVFCDGNYWHHFPDGTLHDELINQELMEKGFRVLRFWESDINDNLNSCVETIIKTR